jgi:hypothetical protein
MENSFVETKLRAANEQLILAQTQIEAAIEAGQKGEPSAAALDGASGSLKAAQLSIGEISRQIEADTEASPNLRACPACGRSIRLEATLCGYCWKKV